MSFAPRTWAVTVMLGMLAISVVGCVSQSTRDAARQGGEAERIDADRDATAARPGSGRFTGAVSLYGEMISGGALGMPANASDNLRQVTASREGSDFDVAVDPENAWLCFASTRHSTNANLYLRRVGGSTVTQLTSDPGNDVMPAFSPDGEHIAFASDRSGTWNIYVKPVDGGKATQITDNPSQELHPSFSPDGRQIVFGALSNRSGQWEMVVVDVDNPANRHFLGFGLFPSFSPDGEKIVFQRARRRGSRTFSIWTVDYADGEASRPTEIAAASNAAAITPTWSPEGDRIAFATVLDPHSADVAARPESAELWVVDVDGTNRVRLTQDHHANLQPAWAGDGVMYFISNRSGHENIWSLRPGGSVLAAEPEGVGQEPQAAAPTPD